MNDRRRAGAVPRVIATPSGSSNVRECHQPEYHQDGINTPAITDRKTSIYWSPRSTRATSTGYLRFGFDALQGTSE